MDQLGVLGAEHIQEWFSCTVGQRPFKYLLHVVGHSVLPWAVKVVTAPGSHADRPGIRAPTKSEAMVFLRVDCYPSPL